MKPECSATCCHLATDLFQGTFLYKLLTWKLPPLVQYPALAAIHLFFYLYLLRGWSILSLVSLFCLATIFFRLVISPAYSSDIQEGEQWVTEEQAKSLYVALYSGLNKFVQYMRGIIQVKGGMKAVAKAAAFMYAALLIKFVGDKALLYIGKHLTQTQMYSLPGTVGRTKDTQGKAGECRRCSSWWVRCEGIFE